MQYALQTSLPDDENVANIADDITVTDYRLQITDFTDYRLQILQIRGNRQWAWQRLEWTFKSFSISRWNSKNVSLEITLLNIMVMF